MLKEAQQAMLCDRRSWGCPQKPTDFRWFDILLELFVCCCFFLSCDKSVSLPSFAMETSVFTFFFCSKTRKAERSEVVYTTQITLPEMRPELSAEFFLRSVNMFSISILQ